jgi:hypothetical protein
VEDGEPVSSGRVVNEGFHRMEWGGHRDVERMDGVDVLVLCVFGIGIGIRSA